MCRPDPTEDVRALCKAYVDPVSGVNACEALVEDKRCVGAHKSLDLIGTVMRAIVDSDAEATTTICKCACWSDIVSVFSDLAEAAIPYDDSAYNVREILTTMCNSNPNVQVQAHVSESTNVQCAINTVQIDIEVMDFQVSDGDMHTSIPVGSSLIIQGLNAMPLGNGDELVVEHQTSFQTSNWQKYPGSTVSFDGAAISGHLEIMMGDSETDTRMIGSLHGLPAGKGGIHIHFGCDVNLANTVGGHFYDDKLCDDPWNNVHYEGPSADIDVVVPGVPWVTTLGHVIVIHDSSGTRVAITRIVPVDAASKPLSEGVSLRLPPHLAFESWTPAICQEDYTTAKSCAMSPIPDSCGSSPGAASSCRSESRQRWCDKDASLVLKVTREIDICATMAIEILMHNPPFKQLDARATVSGFGPGVSIEPVLATVSPGKPGVLASVESPKFIDFSIVELGCSSDNEEHPTSEQLLMCSSPGTDVTFKGRCAGMENELLVSVTPNIDLDSGSMITIAGLVRSGFVGQYAPKLAVEDGLHKHLGVVEWHQETGTLVLVILESDCLEPVMMAAGVQSTFKLLMMMPDVATTVAAISPSVQASLPPFSPAVLASCAEAAEMCSLPPAQQAQTVLQIQEAPASVVIRGISQQTCKPGACSLLTVAFSVNRLLEHDSYFIVSGLDGMDRCDSCLPAEPKCENFDAHDYQGSTQMYVPIPLDLDNHQNDNDHQLFQSLRDRNAEISWHSATNSVVFKVAFGAKLEPYTTYHLSFSLKNGFAAVKPSIRIASYVKPAGQAGYCFNRPALKPNSLSDAVTTCTGELMIDSVSACDDSSDTFEICAPDIFATIHQEHPWPGCGGPRSVLPDLLHQESPWNMTRAVAYTEAEEQARCFQEQRLCDLRNTITLAMKPNIEIPTGTIVTVNGLQNAIDLTLKDEQLHDWIETGSFAFNTQTFTVTFKLAATWGRDAGKTIQFMLTNPHAQQPSPAVSIRVQWTGTSDCDSTSYTVTIDKAIDKITDHTSLIVGGKYTQSHTIELLSEGDAAVLLVQEPKWLVKDVSQSTHDPSEENTISFTLSSNVEVRRGAKITVSGLTGFTASGVNETLVNESSSLFVSICHKITSSNTQSQDIDPRNDTKVLASKAVFDQDAGTVTLTLEQTLTVKSLLDFSFVLTNPCPDDPQVHEASLSLTVTDKAFECDIDCNCPMVTEEYTEEIKSMQTFHLGCTQAGGAVTELPDETGDSCKNTREVTTMVDKTRQIVGPCTCEHTVQGNDCPSLPVTSLGKLTVKRPDFTFKTAKQSTCWPENDNCATISFEANVKFDNTSKVHIAGFAGSQGIVVGDISHVCVDENCSGVEKEWNEGLKRMTLSYSTTVPANTRQTVKVCFKNPPQAQRAPEISIWAVNLCQCVIRIPKTIIEPPTEECDRVLAVAPPSFLNTKITQCHPYVGALNTITATVSTNVPLKRTERKVTISGLVGSQTPDNKALHVFDGKFGSCDGCSGTASTIFEPTGAWSRDRGTLVLKLQENVSTVPGEIYLVQFQLENPPLEQQAPAVSISACKIAASRMQSAGGQAHTCQHTLATTAPPGTTISADLHHFPPASTFLFTSISICTSLRPYLHVHLHLHLHSHLRLHHVPLMYSTTLMYSTHL